MARSDKDDAPIEGDDDVQDDDERDDDIDEAEERGDEFKTLPNGRIRFRWYGSAFLLRAPNMGEFRRFARAYNDLADAASERLQAAGKNVKTADLDQTDELLDWFREVFQALSNRPWPKAEDEVPSWVCAPGLGRQMIGHWRAVPSVPGRK